MNYQVATFHPIFALAVTALIFVIAFVSIGGYVRRFERSASARGSALLGPAIRGWYVSHLQPFEDLCVEWGIAPAALSYGQLIGSVVVGFCYARGLLFIGGWLLLFTGTLDIIDGRVARRTNSGSRRGAFLDSVIDRYADSFAYLGLVYFLRASWLVWGVLFAMVGGLMVSYARARAEGLGVQCPVGMLQRPERYVLLGFGTIFGALFAHMTAPWAHAPHGLIVTLTIIVLALLANITAVQRVVFAWRALGGIRG